jgi:hypothetical protein
MIGSSISVDASIALSRIIPQEMSIPISIEIPDEVTHINLNMIDLSRSIGIILDNAQ